MRKIALAAILAVLPVAGARAAELRVASPGFVYNAGIIDLAKRFEAKTGVKVTVVPDKMTEIVGHVKTGAPVTDIVVLPFDMMGRLALDGGIVPGSFTPLGRVEIGLAVKAGAPHPDISTVEKLAAVLRSGRAVLYSDPKSGSMEARIIDTMLMRPEFAGVHKKISSNGEGGQALRRGEGDMALQLICEVYPYPDIALVAVLPSQLNAHIDGAAAVSIRSTDKKDAEAFLKFIVQPDATATWKAKGLDRFE